MSGSRKAALWGLVAVVVVVVAAIGIPKVLAFVNPPLPPPQPVREARWLDQGWAESDRYWFHHATQGTSTLPIPYVWFVALAEPKILPGKETLFINDGYMQKLGFIPSPPSGGGPAGPARPAPRPTATGPKSAASPPSPGWIATGASTPPACRSASPSPGATPTRRPAACCPTRWA
jgi:hypothetical protein